MSAARDTRSEQNRDLLLRQDRTHRGYKSPLAQPSLIVTGGNRQAKRSATVGLHT
jgi:hypothetical protein